MKCVGGLLIVACALLCPISVGAQTAIQKGAFRTGTTPPTSCPFDGWIFVDTDSSNRPLLICDADADADGEYVLPGEGQLVMFEFGSNDADAFNTDEDGLQCSRAAEALNLDRVDAYTDNASSSATVNMIQTSTPGDGSGTAVLSSALTPTQAGVNGTPDDVTQLAEGDWLCLTIGGTPAAGETIGVQVKGTLQ